ncbi:MAG: HD domain-containing protein [Elusimicrobia bacterium]|nr:HD domain-containing protein [Elusimicrobiota bacterium]
MSTIKIDYKRELELASRGMIMIHDHTLLIRLLVRMLVRKAHLKHAGMILFDPRKEEYVLAVSRGEAGERIPEHFLRFDKDHPLIKIFFEKEYKYLINNRNALLVDDLNKLIWRESVIEGGNGTRELLHKVSDQMPMLNSVACVPAFYRHQLLAILLLGPKKDGERLEQDELDFFAALASDVAMAIRNAQLFEDLRREAERNRNMFVQTAIALGTAIEAKDPYTHGHTERVTGYAVAIARRMLVRGELESSSKFFENLYIASLLHDIGKIGISEAILMKKATLTPEEMAVMKTHAQRGADILSPVSDFEGCIAAVRHHHERYDGSGYPDGLKDGEIPVSASIIAVADSYDAMTTDRPYRSSMTKERAAIEIRSASGRLYDPKVVSAFFELYERGEL